MRNIIKSIILASLITGIGVVSVNQPSVAKDEPAPQVVTAPVTVVDPVATPIPSDTPAPTPEPSVVVIPDPTPSPVVTPEPAVIPEPTPLESVTPPLSNTVIVNNPDCWFAGKRVACTN